MKDKLFGDLMLLMAVGGGLGAIVNSFTHNSIIACIVAFIVWPIIYFKFQKETKPPLLPRPKQMNESEKASITVLRNQFDEQAARANRAERKIKELYAVLQKIIDAHKRVVDGANANAVLTTLALDAQDILKPQTTRWAPFTDDELEDLYKALPGDIGYILDNCPQLEREIEAELKRRGVDY